MQKEAILRKRLPKLKVDGLLITDLNNLRYITGFTGSSGFLIITKGAPVFVTDSRYEEQSKHEVKGFNILIEKEERIKVIKNITKEAGIKKLGFEDHSISYKTYRKLLNRKIRLKGLTGAVEELRRIKSSEEIKNIKTAVQRAERAFKRLLPLIKAGVTEQSLAMRLEWFLKKEGCKTTPFGVIVASGLRSALPHARPSSRRLRKGDIVLFDWGGECEGYFSDITRTVFINGRGDEKLSKIYSIVLKANAEAVRSVKDGIEAKVIDRAARDVIRQGGYGDYFGHGTGHGIGLAIHEWPSISHKSRDKVKEGMVFTIEPGIYLPGLGGVRIEDMVVVTKGGVEVLTRLSRKIHIINP
ncbi:MAG: aminopeptidase P family protein [Nitrospirae bacterium]|nr:aminopeptidase P family protein [Nitrospirota bacterium]